jgi:hypothetical protein
VERPLLVCSGQLEHHRDTTRQHRVQ